MKRRGEQQVKVELTAAFRPPGTAGIKLSSACGGKNKLLQLSREAINFYFKNNFEKEIFKLFGIFFQENFSLFLATNSRTNVEFRECGASCRKSADGSVQAGTSVAWKWHRWPSFIHSGWKRTKMRCGSGRLETYLVLLRLFADERFGGSSWTQKMFCRELKELSNGIR